MFVPLKDDNPLRSISFQFVTIGLIVVNVIVFALTAAGITQSTIASFAVIPGELFGPGPLLPQTIAVPERFTLLTYMFFHGDLLHLGGNMLFLWVFGDNVEDAMGHARFLVFYLLCGVLAGLTHALIMPDSELPLIGASGAVAGVIAAYLMLHPNVRVWVLVFKVIPMQISAAIVLGLWIVTQIVMVMLPQTDQVAWWAHIGGLVAGAVLVIFMRRPGVRLFNRGFPVPQR
ncbi:MAG: rhomboid family intramembrane serine protease [Hyphomicrobiaceae bacterium]|nr:rhomboid family intramembrane serine protease [Hyphomicrobiaceae bacterium]